MGASSESRSAPWEAVRDPIWDVGAGRFGQSVLGLRPDASLAMPQRDNAREIQ